MYFPDFFVYPDKEIFVDGGAFDGGDTLRYLARRLDGLESAYLFEMASANVLKIERNLAHIDNDIRQYIHVVPKGLWKEKGELHFSGQDKSALLTVVQQAENHNLKELPCEVTNLDSEIDAATLIKFEIEGAEIPALEGARGIITKCRPNLAISAYHLSDDVVNIITFIRNLDLGYRIRMRHH